MSDYIEKARQSIDDAVDFFLRRINEISENGPHRKARRIPTTFPMLRLGNDEFYEYAYFERTLECFVRDLLINTILHDLFTIQDIESMWPDNKNYVRYSTESIEDIFPFEFIFINNGKKIGVRYTGLCAGEAAELAEKYEIEEIMQIKWNDELTTRECDQEEYDVITPAEFFKRFLSTEEYELFLSKVLPVVEAANAEIGFETIPRLSLRYLSNFKAEVNEELRHLEIEKLRYKVLPDSKCKEDLSLLCLADEDYTIVRKNFIGRGLYKALLGNAGYAKCFITAEYQYKVFKSGNNFDYTSVVCGYLKFIEQLIYKLTKIRLHYNDGHDLWIKSRSLKKKQREKLADAIRMNPDPKSNATQILHKKEYESYFDITLNPLIWFIHDDDNGWLISDNSRTVIHKLLRNFADECRNDHFHKDNIDVYDIVTCIRNNTLLLAAVLLGGYKLTGNYLSDCQELGIDDDSFDKMYKKIQELPRGITKFIVYFDGQVPIKAYRYFTQEPTVYDDNGSVGASKIRFVSVDEFSGDEYDRAMQGEYKSREFTLTNDNMPVKISYINGRQEEIAIVW